VPSKKRGILFVNPRAGSFSAPEEAEMRSLAEEIGLRVVDVVPGIDVREVVKATLASGLRDIVVAGGDGSIHHVLQALVGTEGILGIIPVGTVNHLARDLGIPLDWREAMRVVSEGSVRQIDTGRVNGIHFLNGVMLGLYPTISEYRERFRSTHSKWRAYFRATRLAMGHFRHVTLVVDSDGRLETIRTQMFIVAVNTYDLTQSGLIALKTSLDDGRLSVYSLSFMDRIAFIRAAAKFMRGKINEVEGFRRMRIGQIRIDSANPKLRVAVDGELHQIAPPLQIAAVPASLLVRAP
jgi:diacylglycerol kinase family enzyme